MLGFLLNDVLSFSAKFQFYRKYSLIAFVIKVFRDIWMRITP